MKFKMISSRDLTDYLGREDILLIDVREKEAYQKGHIPGAVWADWEQLEYQIDNLLSEKQTPVTWVVLYCERGNTSLLAARDLARLGYPVMSLNGGYVGWKHL